MGLCKKRDSGEKKVNLKCCFILGQKSLSFFARKQEKESSSDQHRDPVVNFELISLNKCVEVKHREKLADAAHNGEMCSSTRIISLKEQDTCNEQPCEISEFYPKILDNQSI